jgi:pimeloyl-ACP methyl ester carboxylesterase
MTRHDLRIDVSDLGLVPGKAEMAVTVFAPARDRLPERPIMAFAFPGGGFSRQYYDLHIPGLEGYSQAEHHTAQGMIFVACDPLGVGESPVAAPDSLTLETLAIAIDAMVKRVTGRLRDGSLIDGLGPVSPRTVVGMGQSMGGCLLIVTQGQKATFDAICVLGFSGEHTVLPERPGAPPLNTPQFPRGTPPSRFDRPASITAEQFAYFFIFDDVPKEIVALDLGWFTNPAARPPWRSPTTPAVARTMVSKGVVAPEASVIACPILLATGERDVVPNPHAEPAAFGASRDVNVLITPRMGHMHNFAGTRRLLWDRIAGWSRLVS